jgi:hypothetical protein
MWRKRLRRQVSVALVAASTVIVLFAATPAQATFPARNAKIVFWGDHGRGAEPFAGASNLTFIDGP